VIPAGSYGDIGGSIAQGLWTGLAEAYLPWFIGGAVVLILLMSRK
jgi:hypothetical protein